MKFLKNLSFILNVIFPLVILAIAMVLWGESDLLQLWILVGALPLTGSYWGILFLNFAPRSKGEIFKLFVPFLFAVLAAFISGRGLPLFEGWVIEASGIYTGLNLCFFIGLNYLFLKLIRDSLPGAWKEIQYYCIFLVLFIVLMGGPAYFFMGKSFSLLPEPHGLSVAFYLMQVTLSIASFYPKLVRLYLEKKL